MGNIQQQFRDPQVPCCCCQGSAQEAANARHAAALAQGFTKSSWLVYRQAERWHSRIAMVNFTVLDLFSGIGGFSLGLERAGMETVAFCENDKFCQKVLAKHWPDVPVHNNIEELDGREYKGTVDLICGGFPCQPFSVAGGQRGKEDDRALWPEMLRVIREVEPLWVIGENVPGIINMELDQVLSDLEDSGYSCQTFVVPACAVDAPHRRDRVWIIASHTNFKSKPDGSQYEAERSEQLDVANTDIRRCRTQGQQKSMARIQERRTHDTMQTAESGSCARGDEDVAHADSRHWSREIKGVLGKQSGETSDRFTGSGKDVADAKCLRQQGQGEHEHSGNQEAHRKGQASHALDVGFREKRRSQPRMGGMVDGVSRWLDEPQETPRVIGKVSDRVNRLKALGNAVVPQVVEVLGKAIIEIENLR
jgi:DNA (cytosine-5)-methyltransferase 1